MCCVHSFCGSIMDTWIHLSSRSFSLLPRLMLIALGLKNKIYEKSVFPSASPSIMQFYFLFFFSSPFCISHLSRAWFLSHPPSKLIQFSFAWSHSVSFSLAHCADCMRVYAFTSPHHATTRHATPRRAMPQNSTHTKRIFP